MHRLGQTSKMCYPKTSTMIDLLKDHYPTCFKFRKYTYRPRQSWAVSLNNTIKSRLLGLTWKDFQPKETLISLTNPTIQTSVNLNL